MIDLTHLLYHCAYLTYHQQEFNNVSIYVPKCQSAGTKSISETVAGEAGEQNLKMSRFQQIGSNTGTMVSSFFRWFHCFELMNVQIKQ